MKTRYVGLILIGAAALGTAAFMKWPYDRSLVVHEWGTFTSLQGSGGAPLKWNPLESSSLPKFVYNWFQAGFGRYPSGLLLQGQKSALVTLQRMETPVIYFYSPKKQNVEVTVRFPKGGITEWYPQAPQIGPSFVRPGPLITRLDSGLHQCGVPPTFSTASIFNPNNVKESMIHWTDLKIIPTALQPAATKLLTDSSGSHYFTARDTDSAYVETSCGSGRNSAPQREKFLFYRGVGNFSTPLSVSMPTDATVNLANTSQENLSHLFFLEVRGELGTCVSLTTLKAGERKELRVNSDGGLRSLAAVRKEIREKMESALTAEGLYPREAKAMVNTWEDSWFQEPGARVLYLLPRVWTDELLPISINPAPHQLVRVMVGRAELITPEMEQHLTLEMTQALKGQTDAAQQLRAAAKQLGRFARPAFQEALTRTHVTSEDRGRLLALLSQGERR